jgi:hypothetical protein
MAVTEGCLVEESIDSSNNSIVTVSRSSEEIWYGLVVVDWRVYVGCVQKCEERKRASARAFYAGPLHRAPTARFSLSLSPDQRSPI